MSGAHISCLLITFFVRYMKPLIDAGMIYIARPPLYKVSYGRKKEVFLNNKEELRPFLENIGDDKYTVQRYKGLGEMSAEQIWNTILNPETRTIERLVIGDNSKVDNLLCDLMGDFPELRREFITKNSLFAELDY